MKVVIETVDDLERIVDRDIDCQASIKIDQARIDAFAEVSCDKQWIHVDTNRARRESPFGATVAHGLLLVAMCPRMLREACDLKGVERGLMYGLNRVRFPAPLLEGSTVSAVVRLLEVARLADGGARATIRYQFNTETVDRPCCVAEVVHQFAFINQTTREIAGCG